MASTPEARIFCSVTGRSGSSRRASAPERSFPTSAGRPGTSTLAIEPIPRPRRPMIDRRRRQLPRILVGLAAALIAVACGGCGKGRAPVYPVTGQVLVKGAPADGAFVVFHPQDT